MFWLDPNNYTNIFSIWILFIFVLINLIWSSLVAKSENVIVILKLSIIIIFSIVISFFIKSELLEVTKNYHVLNIFSAVWLTFFAYEGFRVITNTAEDMNNPWKLMLKSITISIIFVMFLYVFVSISVFWNLPLHDIIKAKDYALAEAAKPVFWQIWFTIMAIAALISTSSSINANLYAVTNVFHSTEGLIISSIIISIFIFFFNLGAIASIWAIAMLFIHLLVHIGHLLVIKNTKASKILIYLAILTISITIYLAYSYTSKHINNLWYLFTWSLVLAFFIEILLRLVTWRIVKKQINRKILWVF